MSQNMKSKLGRNRERYCGIGRCTGTMRGKDFGRNVNKRQATGGRQEAGRRQAGILEWRQARGRRQEESREVVYA